jgi:hypothetical protein
VSRRIEYLSSTIVLGVSGHFSGNEFVDRFPHECPSINDPASSIKNDYINSRVLLSLFCLSYLIFYGKTRNFLNAFFVLVHCIQGKLKSLAIQCHSVLATYPWNRCLPAYISVCFKKIFVKRDNCARVGDSNLIWKCNLSHLILMIQGIVALQKSNRKRVSIIFTGCRRIHP